MWAGGGGGIASCPRTSASSRRRTSRPSGGPSSKWRSANSSGPPKVPRSRCSTRASPGTWPGRLLRAAGLTAGTRFRWRFQMSSEISRTRPWLEKLRCASGNAAWPWGCRRRTIEAILRYRPPFLTAESFSRRRSLTQRLYSLRSSTSRKRRRRKGREESSRSLDRGGPKWRCPRGIGVALVTERSCRRRDADETRTGPSTGSSGGPRRQRTVKDRRGPRQTTSMNHQTMISLHPTSRKT
mmetsp:Transcript_35729/g.80272  ORF Transcript_35729/g.80272 Transcript_35729/m.80272 type:complete len:240 (+) Transcript_35729:303-1022(+)